MSLSAGVIDFVRDTLGCSCPEAVFEHVTRRGPETLEGGGTLDVLTVGERLLIYLWSGAGSAAMSGQVPALVRTGRAERDRRGLNRLRVVLAVADPQCVRALAEAVWQGCLERDERTHLHVVPTGSLPWLAGFREQGR